MTPAQIEQLRQILLEKLGTGMPVWNDTDWVTIIPASTAELLLEADNIAKKTAVIAQIMAFYDEAVEVYGVTPEEVMMGGV